MFPDRAFINLNMPKTRLFQQLGADAAFKRNYEEYVESFAWMYSLDPERINTPATEFVSKIDINFLKLKKENIPKSIIQKIESKLPKTAKRIYFCSFDDSWQMVINYRPENPELMKDNGYYLSQRISPDSIELSAAYNLSILYFEFVKRLVSVSPRAGESCDELVVRDYQVQQLEREASHLRLKMQKEVQPKLKIELNMKLQELQKRIEMLK